MTRLRTALAFTLLTLLASPALLAEPIDGLISGWGSIPDRMDHRAEGPLFLVEPESSKPVTTLYRGRPPQAVVDHLETVHGRVRPWVWNDDGPVNLLTREGPGSRFLFEPEFGPGDPGLAAVDNLTAYRDDRIGDDYFNGSWSLVVDAMSTEAGESNVAAGHGSLFWVKWTSPDNNSGVDFPQPDGNVVRHTITNSRFGLVGGRHVLVVVVDRASSTLTLWVDGHNAGVWPAPPENAAQPHHFFSSAGIQGHMNDTFGGILYGVGLWARALTIPEILHLSRSR